MIDFRKRILFVGFGSVAECTLPILVQTHQSPGEKRHRDGFCGPGREAEEVDRPGSPLRERSRHAGKHGVVAREARGGGRSADRSGLEHRLLRDPQWCHDHGVLYINTSVELWDPYAGGPNTHPTSRTLYWRHMNHAPHDGRVGRAGPDRGAGARGQPRPDLALHQAGPDRHRPEPDRRQEAQAGGRPRSCRNSSARSAPSTTWP